MSITTHPMRQVAPLSLQLADPGHASPATIQIMCLPPPRGTVLIYIYVYIYIYMCGKIAQHARLFLSHSCDLSNRHIFVSSHEITSLLMVKFVPASSHLSAFQHVVEHWSVRCCCIIHSSFGQMVAVWHAASCPIEAPSGSSFRSRVAQCHSSGKTIVYHNA